MKKEFPLPMKLMLIVAVVAMLPSLAAGYILFSSRNITKNVGIISSFKQLPESVQTNLDMVAFVRERVGDLDTLEKAISRLEQANRMFFIGALVFVSLGLAGIWAFLSQVGIPIRDVLRKLALFQNEPFDDEPDILSCAQNFDRFFQTSRSVLLETHSIGTELKKKIEPLTSTTAFSDANMNQFFTNVQEISRSSNYIANTLEATTAAIEEVSTSAQTIADRSHKAAQTSAEASAIAGEGRKAVAATIETMESIKDEVLGLEGVIEDLNSGSKQIGDIVNTITNIAHQTNLLALNAAIEAARAGEHGQGFTVVAEEVRKLAEESGEAAEDIGKKVKGMLEKTGIAVQSIQKGTDRVIEGVNVANTAGNNLSHIVEAVTNVNKMIIEISKASTEQSANIDSLRQNIESISGATKITSEGTKRVAFMVNEQLAQIKQFGGTSKELLTLVQMMSDMLEKFNIH